MSLSRSQAAFLAVLSLIMSSRSGAAADPHGLLVLPGAQDVRYTDDQDGTVLYNLPDPHPARATLEQIRSGLEGQGWKPAPDDLLNPATSNSHEHGWTDYIDGTRNDANVFQWGAGWVNAAGDRVEYWLRYMYPKGSSPRSASAPLQVTASYMEASTVRTLRDMARRPPPVSDSSRH